MWVRIQSSARCELCSEITPINAAVPELECLGCGAQISIRQELWESSLRQAAQGGEEIDENATTNQIFEAGEVELTLALSALPPHCPHCDGAWDGEPPETCPHCELAISVRRWDGVTLVGEDQALLAGEEGEAPAESIDCMSCGTPISTDGTDRKITCPSCSRQTVVPDHLWRRLHAPTSVATWWLYTDGENKAGELSRPLSYINALCADDTHVYIIGGYDHKHVLIAMRGREIAWMADLAPYGPTTATNRVCCSGSTVYAYGFMTRNIHAFECKTGQHLKKIRMSKPATGVAVGLDGTLLAKTSAGLTRTDPSGNSVATWAPRGCLWGLLPRGGAKWADSDNLYGAPDGDLRATVGNVLSRVGADGSLKWKILVKGANTSIVPASLGPDGATWVVFRTVGGTMTVEDVEAFTERMMAGEPESASALFRVSPNGKTTTLVRGSGPEEYTSMAVGPEGTVWLARGDGELSAVDSEGNLMWRLR